MCILLRSRSAEGRAEQDTPAVPVKSWTPLEYEMNLLSPVLSQCGTDEFKLGPS